MRELAKILLFSLIVMLGFVGYTNYGIPLIIPEPPPVEEKLTGEITLDQFLRFGNKIFQGKGTCTLCHNPVGDRAPLLDTVGQVASERLKDSRYKGQAENIEEYLRESMIDPSAFVVAGFGKRGTKDSVSPMPDVRKGAIGLSEVEINSVIAFMQSNSGVDVTVPLPSGEMGAAAATEDEEPAEIKVAESAVEAFVKFECATCHIHPLIEEGGDVGPDLTNLPQTAGKRKKGLSAEQFIVESIIDPNAVISEEFEPDLMPQDYAQQITVAELNMMVNAIMDKEEKKEERKER